MQNGAPRRPHSLADYSMLVCGIIFLQAVKPASSRSQSAEIFVVGRNYKAPDFIDSRMLEPKHAFRQDYEIEGGLSCLPLSRSPPKKLHSSNLQVHDSLQRFALVK